MSRQHETTAPCWRPAVNTHHRFHQTRCPRLPDIPSALGLQDDMRSKLGQLESRLRVYRLDEVLKRNAACECWLIMDGGPRKL